MKIRSALLEIRVKLKKNAASHNVEESSKKLTDTDPDGDSFQNLITSHLRKNFHEHPISSF